MSYFPFSGSPWQQLLDHKVQDATSIAIPEPETRTKYTHALGNAGVGRSRCTPKLSGKWVGAGKVVNFGATNHRGFSKQGQGVVSLRGWLFLPSCWKQGSSSQSPGTHLCPGPQHISNLQRNTAKFKDTFTSFKNIHSGTFQSIFNGLHLTLPQTFTVGENGFSSMHSCPGNMWGITITAQTHEQGENSNMSTSGLPEEGQFCPLLAKSSLKEVLPYQRLCTINLKISWGSFYS